VLLSVVQWVHGVGRTAVPMHKNYLKLNIKISQLELKSVSRVLKFFAMTSTAATACR
jgi:hypothetical protein